MANGFGSFYIGNSGLTGAQNALNVTANNLANIDTTGYVREQVRFADKHYITRVGPTMQTNAQQNGLGVSIGDVAHARDIFLDKAYRREAGRKSFYEACYETTAYVEDILQEMDGEEFKQSVQDLWKAFQELSKDPANSTNQNLVLQKAELLLSRTQSVYEDLQSYQANLNGQIKEKVDRINEIGERVYQLNLDIQKVESSHIETAMTLRDERDKLLDELSKYGNIEVKEDATGFDYVSIEGIRLIDDNRANRIDLKEDKTTGFYTPYWAHLSDPAKEEYTNVFHTDQLISTETNSDVGSVLALLIARGEGYGKASDMSPENYSNVQDCVVMETEAEIAYLFKSMVTAINDVFCPNTTYTAADGTQYTVLDVENCSVGEDGSLPPQELYTRQGYDRYTEMQIDGQTFYVYNEEDPDNKNTWYTLDNVSVNKEISKQVTRMPAYQQDGAVDYTLAERLTSIWEEKNMYINPTDTSPCNFEGYYDKIINQLGNSGSVYATAVDTLASTVESVDGQRQQVIGVSSDEELTNMVKFQSAYNAASRYITVISQMTDVIVGLI